MCTCRARAELMVDGCKYNAQLAAGIPAGEYRKSREIAEKEMLDLA